MQTAVFPAMCIYLSVWPCEIPNWYSDTKMFIVYSLSWVSSEYSLAHMKYISQSIFSAKKRLESEWMNEWMNDKLCLDITFLQRLFKATFHGYSCLPLGPDVVGMLGCLVLTIQNTILKCSQAFYSADFWSYLAGNDSGSGCGSKCRKSLKPTLSQQYPWFCKRMESPKWPVLTNLLRLPGKQWLLNPQMFLFRIRRQSFYVCVPEERGPYRYGCHCVPVPASCWA